VTGSDGEDRSRARRGICECLYQRRLNDSRVHSYWKTERDWNPPVPQSTSYHSSQNPFMLKLCCMLPAVASNADPLIGRTSLGPIQANAL
jgi:hypothetical protein